MVRAFAVVASLFAAAFAFRFRHTANSSNEQADIDTVELVGTP